MRVAQTSVDRAQVVVKSVKALVDAKLRPGADLSRADTELDAAMTQLLQAQQSSAVAKTSLAEFTGTDAKTFTAVPGHLLDAVYRRRYLRVPGDLSKNPAAQEQAGRDTRNRNPEWTSCSIRIDPRSSCRQRHTDVAAVL